MKRDKLLGIFCVALGLALLLGSLWLMLRNRQEDAAAAQSAQQVLSVLETAAPTVPAVVPTEVPTEPPTQPATQSTGPAESTDPTDPPTLTSEFVEGHEYVGYLVFPSLDRTLPVMKIAYLEDLQIAPCLEKGSPFTDDAVISAHNYPSHFGPIRDWTGGEEVIFRSLDGQQIRYQVALVQTIQPTDVSTVMDSQHDLVLYTCTTGGEKRVMVACDRIAE